MTMMCKPFFLVSLLLFISTTIDAQRDKRPYLLKLSPEEFKTPERFEKGAVPTTIDPSPRVQRVTLGSGTLRNSGWFGKKRDYYYNVPNNAITVSFEHRLGTSKLNIGSGSGKATLSWDKNAKKARVHAWVNGAVWGTNRVSWTVYAWVIV